MTALFSLKVTRSFSSLSKTFIFFVNLHCSSRKKLLNLSSFIFKAARSSSLLLKIITSLISLCCSSRKRSTNLIMIANSQLKLIVFDASSTFSKFIFSFMKCYITKFSAENLDFAFIKINSQEINDFQDTSLITSIFNRASQFAHVTINSKSCFFTFRQQSFFDNDIHVEIQKNIEKVLADKKTIMSKFEKESNITEFMLLIL